MLWRSLQLPLLQWWTALMEGLFLFYFVFVYFWSLLPLFYLSFNFFLFFSFLSLFFSYHLLSLFFLLSFFALISKFLFLSLIFCLFLLLLFNNKNNFRDSSSSTNAATISIAPISSPGINFVSSQFFYGTCTFSYTISDGNGGAATALVTVNIANGIFLNAFLILSVLLPPLLFSPLLSSFSSFFSLNLLSLLISLCFFFEGQGGKYNKRNYYSKN